MPKDKTEDEKIDEMIDMEITRQKTEGKAKEKPKKEAKKKEKEHKTIKEKKPVKKAKEEKPKEKKETKKEKPKKAKKEKKEKELEKDPWTVLKYPHLAEKSMNMVEMENKLVFIVNKKSTKDDIWEAIEDVFGVNVISVRTQITRKGDKKAYIKLHPDSDAADVATRLGII